MKGKKLQRRFECTGCGGCCTGRGDYYVETSPAEQRTIQHYLGISWQWFRRRYLTVYEDGVQSLRWETNRCVFLDDNRRCKIYPVRPAQCRDYPYWPELLATQAAWSAEARRCEGMGRGAVISLAAIKEQLTKRR